ncbi:ATP-binding protein [Tahibacter caeni]|uniref:ATP-binding protein n=1 Tax=Tahibacter caeni TaxID=1453545 RepID=UPI0021477342|nr:ATP-binding protein [Tahibacter caeni]
MPTAHSFGDRLRGLRLSAMAEHWERQEAALDERSFTERMAELLAAQEAQRADSVLHKGTRQAQSFVSSARWKDLNFKPGRGLTPSVVEALKSWQWLKQKRHLLLTGETGRGKTWLASALANEAVMAGFKVRCFEVGGFLQQFYEEEQSGRIFRFIADLTRADLVVLDRWAHHPLDAHGVARLEELILKRDGKASFVVCSSRPVVDWENWLGGGPVAKGIVDRLVSRANLLELKGPSLRGEAPSS